MTKASSSAVSGDGSTIATHTLDSKEVQVVVIAHPDSGELRGTIPTYTYWRPYTAGAQNQRILDIFNASGSGKLVKIRKLFLHHNQATVTGVVATFDLIRTSAVGTGGTVLTGGKMDTADANIPAQVTTRHSATGGATEGATIFGIAVDNEETRPGTPMAPMINWMPEGDNIADLCLREGEGFLVKQITNTTVGVWGCLLVVTIE